MRITRKQRRHIVETLGRVDLFRHCSPSSLCAIDRLCTPLRIEAGDVLIAEGAYRAQFIVIVSGHAVIERQGELIDTVGPGSFVGEMALLGHTACNATVRAETPMQVLTLTAAEFSSLRAEDEEIDGAIVKAAFERQVMASVPSTN